MMLRVMLGAFLLSACKSESADEPERKVALECPAGAKKLGNPPPTGDRVWCETQSGTAHGPFLAWHPDGSKKTEGAFVQGDADGEWTSWYESGQLRSRGRYEHGKAVGVWERWDRDGKQQEAQAEQEGVEAPPSAYDTPPLTGLAACDRYIQGYSKCIETKAPEAAKAGMREAFKTMSEEWRQAAQGPARDDLERACKAAHEAVAKTATGWGCEF